MHTQTQHKNSVHIDTHANTTQKQCTYTHAHTCTHTQTQHKNSVHIDTHANTTQKQCTYTHAHTCTHTQTQHKNSVHIHTHANTTQKQCTYTHAHTCTHTQTQHKNSVHTHKHWNTQNTNTHTNNCTSVWQSSVSMEWCGEMAISRRSTVTSSSGTRASYMWTNKCVNFVQ